MILNCSQEWESWHYTVCSSGQISSLTCLVSLAHSRCSINDCALRNTEWKLKNIMIRSLDSTCGNNLRGKHSARKDCYQQQPGLYGDKFGLLSNSFFFLIHTALFITQNPVHRSPSRKSLPWLLPIELCSPISILSLCLSPLDYWV